MSTYLLGIDVGTSGSKAVLIDEEGVVVAVASAEYPLHTPHPLWAEQDPEQWWEGSAASVRDVVRKAGIKPEEVAAIGLTGQMHGLVMLDAAGAVLRRAILWNDQRTAAECAEITEKLGAKRVIELTGNPVLPGFTAPKIVWVRKHEPDVYDRTAKFLLPKDYVRYRLTGAYITEVSDASGTSLLEVRRRRWSEEMAEAAGVPKSWLPEVTESPEVSSRLHAEAARRTGLLEGTPVVSGAGDQAAGAVGAGIVEEGSISVALGTSGVVFAASDEYRVDPNGRLHAFCHAVPGKWHLMGVMLSAAGSFRWYHDVFGELERARAKENNGSAFDLLTEAAARVPAGSGGLIFLPYLSGERTPHPDPNARGVLFGLTLGHSKAHCTRAVLEGVAFGLKDSLELMRNLGITADAVRIAGGGAKSPLWRQIFADVFDCRVNVLAASEGAAYGAALLASVGAGVHSTVEDTAINAVKTTSVVEQSGDVERYKEYYRHYRALYPVLAPEFAALAETESKLAASPATV